MVKARLIVKGNVQGVGYRTLVKLFARRLGIKGLIRNLDDGSVEVFVEGSKLAIKKFLKRIEVKGKPEDPLSLHVGGIDAYWEGQPGYEQAWKEYSGFELDYGVKELSPAERETLESLEWSKLHFVGMSNVFREELGGVKGEIGGMRGDIKEMHGEIRGMRGEIGEMRGDMKAMRGDMKEVRLEVKGMRKDVRDMHAGINHMRGDIRDVHSEIKGMRTDVNKSFQEMAKRYDAISSELVRTREELTRAVNGLLKLIEEFIHERHGTGLEA